MIFSNVRVRRFSVFCFVLFCFVLFLFFSYASIRFCAPQTMEQQKDLHCGLRVTVVTFYLLHQSPFQANAA